MKILNEEHFENVKRYAESIGDTSLQKCLERLKSWEGNPDYPSEISLYYDHAPYSFGFTQHYADGRIGIVGGLLYHGIPDKSFCRNIAAVPRMADTYLKNMKLDNGRKADFRTENPRSAFSFLAVKIAVFRADCAGRPLSGAGLAERKSSSLRCGIFFRQALPQSPENRLERHQEIKMPTHVGRCFT